MEMERSPILSPSITQKSQKLTYEIRLKLQSFLIWYPNNEKFMCKITFVYLYLKLDWRNHHNFELQNMNLAPPYLTEISSGSGCLYSVLQGLCAPGTNS